MNAFADSFEALLALDAWEFLVESGIYTGKKEAGDWANLVFDLGSGAGKLQVLKHAENLAQHWDKFSAIDNNETLPYDDWLSFVLIQAFTYKRGELMIFDPDSMPAPNKK